MTKHISSREVQVLNCMVKNPLFTDREISLATDLKLSTVTAIRRRLKERDYYHQIRIPSIHGLGGEMLAVTYSHYRPSVPSDIRLITGKRLAEAHKEVFWTISEYNQSISLELSRNLTDLKKNISQLEQLYTAQSFLDEGDITLIAFPFEIAEIYSFFDFAPFMAQSFGLAPVEIGLKNLSIFETEKGLGSDMTDMAKKVYIGLIEFPEHTDTALAKEIGISQRTVTKLRKQFEVEGLIKTAIIPNLEKLGFKMLVFDHAKLNLRMSKKHREETIKALLSIKPPIFFAIGGNDVVAITPYEDFETYRRSINHFSEVYKQDDIFIKDPKRLMFSLAEMEIIKEHDYLPIVKKLLGV